MPELVDIILPDQATGQEPLVVSCWLVDVGDTITAGSRLLEIRLPGMVFELTAPVDGTLVEVLAPMESPIRVGETLGRLEKLSAEN